MSYLRWIFILNNYDENVEWKRKFTMVGFTRSVVGFKQDSEGIKYMHGFVECRHPVPMSIMQMFLPNASWKPARYGACCNYDSCTSEGSRYFTTGDWHVVLKWKRIREATSRRVLATLFPPTPADLYWMSK